MIDCAHYRRSILADPHDPNPELRLHRASCPDCGAFTEELLRFEERLTHALHVSAPQIETPRVRPPRRALRVRRGWLAMAASVLVALVAGSLWLAAPGPSLAADVVGHMAGEPEAWARTDVSVPPSELLQVLRGSQLRLEAGAGRVSYARTCSFRGHRVPHLVVQTDMGPVTVMVLTHESVRGPVPFDEEGYRGVIIPEPGHGSLAVLARGPSADLDAIRRIAARVREAIVWTG